MGNKKNILKSFVLIFSFLVFSKQVFPADFSLDKEFGGKPSIHAFSAIEKVARKQVGTISLIAQQSLHYLGIPYRWAGIGPKGFDCSGFVFHLFRRFHVKLPRMADQQYCVGLPVSKQKLQAGDLVFFSTYTSGVSHVGVYLGHGRFIHASPHFGVSIANLSNSYFVNRYVGARRIYLHKSVNSRS